MKRLHRLSFFSLSRQERELRCDGGQTELDGARGPSPTSGPLDTSLHRPEPRFHFKGEDNNTGSWDCRDMTQIKLCNTRVLTLVTGFGPSALGSWPVSPTCDELKQRHALPFALPPPRPCHVRGRVATGFRVWRASTERLAGLKIGSFLLARLMAAT